MAGPRRSRPSSRQRDIHAPKPSLRLRNLGSAASRQTPGRWTFRLTLTQTPIPYVGGDITITPPAGPAPFCDFEDFIETSFLAYFSYYANNPGDYGLLRSNRGREGGYLSGPQTRAGLEELREDLLQAIQAGIVPDLDVDFMTSAISGSAFSILDEMMTRTPPDPVQTARFASRLYLGGVRSFVTK